DLREDEVRRAVQDALEGFDPRAAERLLEQVEHRRPVHHGPFVTESNVIPACELAQQTIVVDDRAFVRGDHVLAGPKCGEDMIEGDLAGRDPQRGDLDDHVRSSPTYVFGRAARTASSATAASWTPTPVSSAIVISCSEVRPRFSPAAISPSSA